ncbi:BBE domain-containing protein [Streptomyces sp. AM 4-1-1]|uniref:FAD-dependent oxidoreductase n=1 Tax=Streptomyces sp. AM 4-1-1 TaxID=3028710 RepID=UPI0023B8BE54|nr:BBE domain-containing protein [Streptomyces sp. AM 4-1-1]WEH36701.1 BBE domain-containing protein [Streptomyces sp. AM 4-1-1]
MSMISRRNVLASAVAVAATTAVAEAGPSSAFAETPAANVSLRRRSLPNVVLPDDARYGDLIVGNNARWRARPESVHLVRSTSEVVQAVQEAVDGDKRLSVKSGGHCYCDFVYNPEVHVVIDTSTLNDVSYDELRRAFVVEAGATLLNAYEALYKGWGVTIPGGMCYSVGAGGHFSGGGYGMLSRKHGLSIDHLYAVEVVVVDTTGKARAVVATRDAADPNRDLWWAHTGGGGGNFGVVTRYWFRTPGTERQAPARQLVTPPKEVLVSALSLPWSALDEDSFTGMVRAFGNWHERNAAVGSPYASLCSFLMMNHKSNGSIGLLTQIDATVPGAQNLLASYLRDVTAALGPGVARPMAGPTGEFGPLPELFTPQRLPWLTAVRLLGTSNPTLSSPVMRGAHKSAYLRKGFTDAQIGSMYRNLVRADHANPSSMVVLLSFGGRINSVPPSATASAQRDSIFKGLFQSFWAEEQHDAENIAWTRDVYREVFAATGGYPVPGTDTDGCYINYPDTDITDPAQNTSGVPWQALYYKGNYSRLQQIKAMYDPRDVFRHAQSIRLPE